MAIVATLLSASLLAGSLQLPAAPLAELPAHVQSSVNWEIEYDRLRLHNGLSWGFAGAMIVTGTLLFVVPGNCSNPDPDFGCGEIILPFIFGMVLLPLAAIPIGTGIYWSVRIRRHKRARQVAVFRPTLGGFSLQF